ncbi:MAG: ABC transporter permease [Candidatus Methanodesulfokora sp.]
MSIKYWKQIVDSLLSLMAGFFVGGIIIWLAGFDPLLFYQGLLIGAFGNLYYFMTTLSYAAPLMLTGLSFAIAARASLFNVGAEGQSYLGALAAVSIGAFLTLPNLAHQLLIIVFAFVLGGLLGGLAGWLKVSRSVNEVVSTIMLNYLSLYISNYLFTYWLYDPMRAYKTKNIETTAILPFVMPGTDLSLSLFLAVLASFFIYILLWKTPFGYEIRAVGLNPTAASYGGINVRRSMALSMFISGGVAALAGAFEVMGRFHCMDTELTYIKGYGFDGIAVSLIGRNHPIAIIPASILFAMLKTGVQAVQRYTSVGGRTGVPLELGLAVQGVIIVFVALPSIIDMIRRMR